MLENLLLHNKFVAEDVGQLFDYFVLVHHGSWFGLVDVDACPEFGSVLGQEFERRVVAAGNLDGVRGEVHELQVLARRVQDCLAAFAKVAEDLTPRAFHYIVVHSRHTPSNMAAASWAVLMLISSSANWR